MQVSREEADPEYPVRQKPEPLATHLKAQPPGTEIVSQERKGDGPVLKCLGHTLAHKQASSVCHLQ